MQEQTIHHVAIPSRSLEESYDFFVGLLEARVVRRSERRICLDFHGMQLVCHNAREEEPPTGDFYPRHFGLIFRTREGFRRMLHRVRAGKIEILWGPRLKHRGEDDEQIAFYIREPSNNVVEFKYYTDPSRILGEPPQRPEDRSGSSPRSGS